MNLRKFANIFKRNTKSKKTVGVKDWPRFDLFLVIALFILIITPIVIMMVNKISADFRLVNLFVSPRFEELFGKEITESLLNEFNEANSGIRVRLLNPGDKNNSGKEPDIIIYDESDVFDEEAALAVLNSYLEYEPEEDYKALSISLVSFMDVLFYNIDILSAAGFDRPPRTRGDYQNYSRTVSDNGIYCDALSEPENNRPANRKLEDFAEGKAALIVASTRAIPFLREKMGDEVFGITAIPYATDGSVGRYNINLSGIYSGINKNCANTDAAWSFIVFLREQSPVFCEKFKAIPGTASDVIPGDYVTDDPFYSKAWDIFEHNRSEGL